MLAALTMFLNVELAVAADKQTQWKNKFRYQQRLEETITSMEKSLAALEEIQQEALPNVPLGGVARTVVPKQLKFVRVKLRNLDPDKMPEDTHATFEDLKERYQSVRVFFANKEKEVASPAQQFVRRLYENLEDLEASAETGASESMSEEARLLMIWDTARNVARVQEHDANYPLQEALERFEPHAEEYVVAKQQLLEIQPGAEQQQHALYYLGLAQKRIENGVPPHDAKLKQFLKRAEGLIKESRELAPSYYNPEHMDEKLEEFRDYTIVPELESTEPT
ncbi:hypothetical protein [Denitrobaculum tricleocarpae]|uniref:Uncharacterized protein n=1 Tax=Denitrobaculum tricleocarpae TaxID=2591009 RepID=A0A545SXZ8_9PROT|nr:hypothetical protein [Denitrobaculum tricleocarpae]TQV69837.1 hypothetical protein FKG95_28580 [Denitrobaculum tricleocarpae]